MKLNFDLIWVYISQFIRILTLLPSSEASLSWSLLSILYSPSIRPPNQPSGIVSYIFAFVSLRLLHSLQRLQLWFLGHWWITLLLHDKSCWTHININNLIRVKPDPRDAYWRNCHVSLSVAQPINSPTKLKLGTLVNKDTYGDST